jgi:hypothetical protein
MKDLIKFKDGLTGVAESRGSWLATSKRVIKSATVPEATSKPCFDKQH